MKLSHCEEHHHNDFNWQKQQPICTRNSSHTSKSHVSSAKSMRLHMQARSAMCCSNDPKYKRKKVVHRKKQQHCLQASSRQAVQESDFVNNCRNINSKFTAIKSTLTSREALSSQDNTQCCCSTTGIQPGVSNPV